MAVQTITNATTDAWEHRVDDWVDENSQSAFLSRVSYLALCPLSSIAAALDTIVGLGATFAVLLSGFSSKRAAERMDAHLGESSCILAIPYRLFLKFLVLQLPESTGTDAPMISGGGCGFAAAVIIDLDQSLVDCAKSSGFFKRHVVSRLGYALLAIVSVVTRAVDGLIAIPAAALSIVLLGRVESLNNLAFRALQAPAVIGDLAFVAPLILYPQTYKLFD